MAVTANSQKITDDQITKHQPLVKNIAFKFKNSGEPLEDLEQVGYIGLINTLNLYNQNRGGKLKPMLPGLSLVKFVIILETNTGQLKSLAGC